MHAGGFPFADFFHEGGVGEDDHPPEKETKKKEIRNKEFYQILGIDPKATEAEIKRAFRKKCIVMHPDRGGDTEKVL